MLKLLPYLINGISAGGQYALIAIGYTLVYGILRLINFAHGDVFMVAGLILVYSSSSLPSRYSNIALPSPVLLSVFNTLRGKSHFPQRLFLCLRLFFRAMV